MRLSTLHILGAVTVAVVACSSAAPTDTVVVEVQGDDGGLVIVTDSSTGSSSGGHVVTSGEGGSQQGTTSDGGTSMHAPTGDGGAASGLPCDVANYLAANCTGCHSDPPVNGSLAGLVTYADLMKNAIEDPTKTELQLSIARMQGNPAPYMPPGATPSAADVAILQNWLTAGATMGTCGGSGSDGGVVAPPSVFNGQPPFMSQSPSGGHNAGRACFSCHTSSCTGGGDCGPELVFGGTLYDGSGAAVAGAEVRFVDANGNGTSVYTSTSGDFWLRGSSAFAGPAHVGVRNAAVQNMITPLQSTSQPPAVTGGDCNACHCTGTGCTVAPIHLP
jgi:hypothetical protein